MKGYVFEFTWRTFTSKKALRDYVKGLLKSTPSGTMLTKQQTDVLSEVLSWHPKAAQKQGAGVAGFRVVVPDDVPNCKCYAVVRVDGSTETFSYRACFGAAATHKQNVLRALRHAILPDVLDAKQQLIEAQRTADGMVLSSAESGQFTESEMALDHWPTPFATIVEAFFKDSGLEYDAIAVTGEKIPKLIDSGLSQAWLKYHRNRASYRLISGKLNSKLGRHS